MKKSKIIGLLFAFVLALFTFTLVGCKSSEKVRKEVNNAYKELTYPVHEEGFELKQFLKNTQLTFTVKEGDEKYISIDENGKVTVKRPAFSELSADEEFVKVTILYTCNDKKKTTGELQFKIKKLPITVVEETEAMLNTTVFNVVTAGEYFNGVVTLSKELTLIKNKDVKVAINWAVNDIESKIVSLENATNNFKLRKKARLDGGDKDFTLIATYKIDDVDYKKEVTLKTKQDVKYDSLLALQQAILASDDLKTKLKDEKKSETFVLDNLSVYKKQSDGLFYADKDSMLIFAYKGLNNKNEIAPGKKLDDYKNNPLLVSCEINQRYGVLQIKILDVIEKHNELNPKVVYKETKIDELVNTKAVETGDMFLNKPIKLVTGESSKLLLTMSYTDQYGIRFFDKKDENDASKHVMVYYQSNLAFLKERFIDKQDGFESVECILNGYRTNNKCWYVSFITDAKKIADCTEIKMLPGYDEVKALAASKALQYEVKHLGNSDLDLATIAEYALDDITFAPIEANAEGYVAVTGSTLGLTKCYEKGKVKKLQFNFNFTYRDQKITSTANVTLYGFDVHELNLQNDLEATPSSFQYNTTYHNYQFSFKKGTAYENQPLLTLKNPIANMVGFDLLFEFPYKAKKEKELWLAVTYFKADGTVAGIKEFKIDATKKHPYQTLSFEDIKAPKDSVKFSLGLSKNKHTEELKENLTVRVKGITVYS